MVTNKHWILVLNYNDTDVWYLYYWLDSVLTNITIHVPCALLFLLQTTGVVDVFGGICLLKRLSISAKAFSAFETRSNFFCALRLSTSELMSSLVSESDRISPPSLLEQSHKSSPLSETCELE